MIGKIFEALSDPHRRQIIELLSEKDRNASELLSHFSFRQSSLSHHLKILSQAEIIKGQKRGQFVYYTLQKQTLFEALKAIWKLLWHEKNTEENNGENI